MTRRTDGVPSSVVLAVDPSRSTPAPAVAPSVPPHLSDAERALWEKADALIAASQRDNEAAARDGGDSPLALATNGAWLDAMQAFSYATTPGFIHSLLTALSSEREAGEKLRERMAQMVETHNRTITYREGQEGLPPGTIPRWTAPSTETPR